MTWAKLLADKTITAIPPTRGELDNLRSIVTRSLGDVTAAGLSADARFIETRAEPRERQLNTPIRLLMKVQSNPLAHEPSDDISKRGVLDAL
jgi:hypothetical protein